MGSLNLNELKVGDEVCYHHDPGIYWYDTDREIAVVTKITDTRIYLSIPRIQHNLWISKKNAGLTISELTDDIRQSIYMKVLVTKTQHKLKYVYSLLSSKDYTEEFCETVNKLYDICINIQEKKGQ